MKKKLMVFVVGVFLAIMGAGIFVGCNKGVAADVEVFIYSFPDAYVTTVRTAMEKEFKAANISYHFNDGQNSEDRQNQQIDTALNNGAKFLMVNLVNPGATASIQEKADAKNAKVIFFNKQDPTFDYKEKGSLYVGSGLDGGGTMQGEMIVERLTDSQSKFYLGDDVVVNGEPITVKAMTLFGQPAHPDAQYRTITWINAANSLLEEKGLTNITISFDGITSSGTLGDDVHQMPVGQDWSPEGAQNVINTLKTSPGFAKPGTDEAKYSIIEANNDDMAMGAANALGEQAGDLIIVGVDATEQAQEYVKDGRLAGTVKQQGDLMAKCLVSIASQVKDAEEDITIQQALELTEFDPAKDSTYVDSDLVDGMPEALKYYKNDAVVRMPYLPFDG